MESQLQRPTHGHHHYEEDPHHNVGLQSVREGEGETEHNHHGEKKSVLKKVKDKAKKIKDKIKHGGHGHDEEDHDEEDEETVIEYDVHGAPIVANEAAFISGTTLPKQTGLNLENPTIPLEDRLNPSVGNDVYQDVGNVGVTTGADRHPNTRNEVHSGVRDDPLFKTSTPIQDPCIVNTRKEGFSSVGDDQVFKTPALIQDPYITNTRKDEHSGVEDDPVFKTSATIEDPYFPSTRKGDVEDVGLPLEAPNTDLLDPLPVSTGTKQRAMSEPEVKIGSAMDLENDPHAPGNTAPSNYQSKVVDPTGQGGEEAEVGPLLERLGNLHVSDAPQKKPYTGSHDQFAPQPTPVDKEFNPEQQPKSFDTETSECMPRDTVAGKLSAIADKASSAKDVVASKLGYGSSQRQEGQESSKTTALESVREYGHKVAGGLAPVYGKVAGAGSAIMSKVEGHGGDSVTAKESDKGVSVQEYLAEKFSPGDEDKELSKVITDAIHRKKERGPVGQQPEPVKETVTVEAVASNEKAAAGVVDRVRGAIGSWLGKSHEQGEGLEKEVVTKLKESDNDDRISS